MQYRVGGVQPTGLTAARGVRRCPQYLYYGERFFKFFSPRYFHLCTKKKPEVSIVFLRGDIKILVSTLFLNFGFTFRAGCK
jgi:hypothetical protein